MCSLTFKKKEKLVMIKRLFLILLAIALITCSINAPYEPDEDEEIVSDTTRYVYTYETRNQMNGAKMTFEYLGYPIFYTLQTIHTIIVDVPAGKAVLKKFTNSAGDEYPALFTEKDEMIWELLSFEESGFNDDTTLFWHNTMIQADLAWEAGYRGNGVRALIIDSGLCPDYREMEFFAAFDSTMAYNPYTDSTDIEDVELTGHGSHVFGILAGQPHPRLKLEETHYYSGVAPKANVGMIKMFQGQWASRYMAVKSVDKAISYNPDIISMSWGGTRESVSLSMLFQKGSELGITFVAAAGNSFTTPLLYPARYPSVIAVGSVDSDTTRSRFSSYGAELEIMAPGENILSFWGCSPGQRSGTSMAAPQITGAIALYIQKYKLNEYGEDDVYLWRPPVILTRTHLRMSALDFGEYGFVNDKIGF